MSETQQLERQAPQLKADNSVAPQLAVARKVARKAVALKGMGDAVDGAAGAAAGDQMAGITRTPAAIAQEGFAGSPVELPFRAKMEQSFGRSFADVRAYVGGPAA